MAFAYKTKSNYKEKWIRKEGSKGNYNSAERGKRLKVSGSIRAKIKFQELRQLDASGASRKVRMEKDQMQKKPNTTNRTKRNLKQNCKEAVLTKGYTDHWS